MVFHGGTGVGVDDRAEKGIFHLSLMDKVAADHVGSCRLESMGKARMRSLSENMGVVG